MTGRHDVTFWFEFASTYSYLAAMRVDAAAQERGVSVTWRPFLLGPIFAAQGWTSSPFNIFEAKGRNMWRDMERRAAARGLPPVVQPPEFPQNSLLAARLATHALTQAWGKDFVRRVYSAQFAEGRDIGEGTLREILADLGRDPDLALAAAKDPQTKAQLRAAGDEAAAFGIYGAPSFTTADGELFWGDDRMQDALGWAARLD